MKIKVCHVHLDDHPASFSDMVSRATTFVAWHDGPNGRIWSIWVILLPLLSLFRSSSPFYCHRSCTPVPLFHYSPHPFFFTVARSAKVTQLWPLQLLISISWPFLYTSFFMIIVKYAIFKQVENRTIDQANCDTAIYFRSKNEFFKITVLALSSSNVVLRQTDCC